MPAGATCVLLLLLARGETISGSWLARWCVCSESSRMAGIRGEKFYEKGRRLTREVELGSMRPLESRWKGGGGM